jgi:hypothetical protein
MTAAGEEIGWRGYMLTRLVDAGIPRPVLASGLIWGLWHVPVVLALATPRAHPPRPQPCCSWSWQQRSASCSRVYVADRQCLARDRASRRVEQHHPVRLRYGENGRCRLPPGRWRIVVGRRVGCLTVITMIIAAGVFSRGAG